MHFTRRAKNVNRTRNPVWKSISGHTAIETRRQTTGGSRLSPPPPRLGRKRAGEEEGLKPANRKTSFLPSVWSDEKPRHKANLSEPKRTNPPDVAPRSAGFIPLPASGSVLCGNDEFGVRRHPWSKVPIWNSFAYFEYFVVKSFAPLVPFVADRSFFCVFCVFSGQSLSGLSVPIRG